MRGACPLQPTQVSHAPAFALAGLESLVRRQRHAPPVAGSTLCTALCPPPPNHQLRLIPIPHLAQGTVQLLPNGSAAFLHHNNAKLRLDGSGDRSLPALNRLTAPAAEDLAATLITNGYRLQAAQAQVASAAEECSRGAEDDLPAAVAGCAPGYSAEAAGQARLPVFDLPAGSRLASAATAAAGALDVYRGALAAAAAAGAAPPPP